jgi:hypothetical protein
VKHVVLALGVCSFFLLASSSSHGSITYDGNVTPAVIFGTGNGNGSWTIDTENGVQAALRAKVRKQGIYNSKGDGTYGFSTGTCPDSSTLAVWNYEFAVNVGDSAIGGNRTLNDVKICLWIDTDPTQGVNYGMGGEIFAILPDSEVGTSSTGSDGGKIWNTAESSGRLSDYSVVQNSSNVGWLGFNVFADATYDFLLTVEDSSNSPLASVSMEVVVGKGGAPVPEPATCAIWTLFGGIGTFAGWRRRKLAA